MRTIQLNEAQSRLGELVDSASAGEEIIITKDQKPVARLTSPGLETSLRDLCPSSVGAVLRPLGPDEDLLEEMLDHDRD